MRVAILGAGIIVLLALSSCTSSSSSPAAPLLGMIPGCTQIQTQPGSIDDDNTAAEGNCTLSDGTGLGTGLNLYMWPSGDTSDQESFAYQTAYSTSNGCTVQTDNSTGFTLASGQICIMGSTSAYPWFITLDIQPTHQTMSQAWHLRSRAPSTGSSSPIRRRPGAPAVTALLLLRPLRPPSRPALHRHPARHRLLALHHRRPPVPRRRRLHRHRRLLQRPRPPGPGAQLPRPSTTPNTTGITCTCTPTSHTRMRRPARTATRLATRPTVPGMRRSISMVPRRAHRSL